MFPVVRCSGSNSRLPTRFGMPTGAAADDPTLFEYLAPILLDALPVN